MLDIFKKDHDWLVKCKDRYSNAVLHYSSQTETEDILKLISGYNTLIKDTEKLLKNLNIIKNV